MIEIVVRYLADIETWATDSFEAKYKAMMGQMSDADIKRSAEQVIHLCQCSNCPTNCETQGMHVLRLFNNQNNESSLGLLLYSGFSRGPFRSVINRTY